MIFSVSNWISTCGVFILQTRKADTSISYRALKSSTLHISYTILTPTPLVQSLSNQKNLKLRIFGLPLSVADSAVCEMFYKLNVKLTSKIMYEKIRDPETKRMTSVLNGTRFLFIEPLPDGKSLPKFNYCAGFQCKIFHFGQPKKQETCFLQTA